MDISNVSMDLLDPAMVVTEVVIGLILAIVGLFIGIIVAIVGGIVVGIVIFEYKWKRAEESKKRDKLEQTSQLIKSLLPDININQKRLHPLSDCVGKVIDCANCEYSETETLPQKLYFERNGYSYLLDKIGLLDYEIIDKLIRFYSETKDIEEKYKKLNVIHGLSHEELYSFMLIFEMDEKLGEISYPRTCEIQSFLRKTKKVYDLGADLIKSMENNTGA